VKHHIPENVIKKFIDSFVSAKIVQLPLSGSDKNSSTNSLIRIVIWITSKI